MRKSIYFIMFIIFIATVTAVTQYPYASNPVSFKYFWDIDEGSGNTLTERINSLTLTHTGAQWNSTDPIAGSYSLQNIEDKYSDTADTNGLDTGIISISMWLYDYVIPDEEFIIAQYDDASECAFRIATQSGGGFYIWTSDSGSYDANENYAYGTSLASGWAHYVFLMDPGNSNCSLYINASLVETDNCGTGSSIYQATEQIRLGGAVGQVKEFDGMIDQVGIATDLLTQDEITNIYTGTYVALPTWQPPTPDDTSANNTQVILNATCDSGNVSIWFDSNNPPLTLVVDNQPSPASYTTSVVSDGTYYYTSACTDGANTSMRSWIYDTTEPDISLNSTNGYTSVNTSRVNQYTGNYILPIDITISDANDLYGFLLNMTHPNGTSYYSYLNESLSGLTEFEYKVNINTSTFPGNVRYLISKYSSDSHTNENIGDYKPKKITNGIDFNTAEGNHIWIESEDCADFETEKESDRYTIDIKFCDGLEKKRSFTIRSDHKITYLPNSPYLGHFIIGDVFGGNWLDWIGAESEYIVTRIDDYTYIIEFEKMKDVKLKSIGGMNTNSLAHSWFKGTSTLITPVGTSGTPITFTLNLSRDSYIQNITSSIIYNGTSYPITADNQSGYILFTANIDPYNITTDTTYNYNWTVNVIQDQANYTFYVSGSHTVYTLILDNCTTGEQITAIFSIFDEDNTGISLNSTLEIDGTYYQEGNPLIRNISLDYPLATSFNLCLYPNNTIIKADLYLKYDHPGGFTQRWYLVNQTLNNQTLSVPMGNYNDTTDVSDLKITVRQVTNYQYYPNIYTTLQRRYVSEGVWRSVQMDKSGDYGLIFFNIKEENTDYRLIFKDGYNNILLTTQSLKFICSANLCELTQTLNPYSVAVISDTPAISAERNNITGVINVNWSISTGQSATVRSIITKETPTGTLSLCDDSATGNAGVFTCNTSGYFGVFDVKVISGGSLIFTDYLEAPDDKISDYISIAEQTFWAFIIMVTVMAFGLFSPVGVIIAAVLGLIFIYFMGILNALTITGIATAAVIGIAISIKIKT